MTELVQKIRSRGYWESIIRPSRFVEKRIADIVSLRPIIERSSVQTGGWDFPHIDPRRSVHTDLNWVGQESEWQHHLEVWRLYESGQFYHLRGMSEDWRDQSEWWTPDAHWRPGLELGIGAVLFTFTQIFELAARLSLSEAGDEIMEISVTVGGLNGRRLWMDHPRRLLFNSYVAEMNVFPQRIALKREELIGDVDERALDAAIELFRRFNWEPNRQVLREHQNELRR